MNQTKQNPLKKILAIRGMGGALTAFAGLIIIYIVFGIINPTVYSGQNIMNLLRSMSKYLLIGIGQSYVLITGNIDLSIGSMVGMSAMISATMMAGGVSPFIAILVALLSCLAIGVMNGFMVGKFKLPPFIATLGTMFVARGVAYMVNGNRNTEAISSGIGKEAADGFQNFFYYGKTLGVYNTFWIAVHLIHVPGFHISHVGLPAEDKPYHTGTKCAYQVCLGCGGDNVHARELCRLDIGADSVDMPSCPGLGQQEEEDGKQHHCNPESIVHAQGLPIIEEILEIWKPGTCMRCTVWQQA